MLDDSSCSGGAGAISSFRLPADLVRRFLSDRVVSLRGDSAVVPLTAQLYCENRQMR